MRLLIDNCYFNSPGAIKLQKELITSLVESSPINSEVLLAYNSGERITGKLDTNCICMMKHPHNTWLSRWKWYNIQLLKIAKDYNVDVVFSLSGISSPAIKKYFGTVITINNMEPFTYNNYDLYPKISKDLIRLFILRKLYVRNVRLADSIVVFSKSALDIIASCAGDISYKTQVSLTGVPRDFNYNMFKPPSNPYMNKPFIIYFSTIYPYKNHLRLIEAYANALTLEKNLPDLLIAGIHFDDKLIANIMGKISMYSLDKKIKYLGKLASKDIPSWLYHAEFNLFPSLIETNSVIIAEIMSLGGVLACSDIPSLAEVAKNSAIYFDPFSIESMRDTIINLHNNPEKRKKLSQRALKRSAELSWEACGNTIWSAVKRAKTAINIRKGKNGF
jgi:glycosyltransferase involved in cell wall biosynthesis